MFPFGCNLQPDTALYFGGPLLICPFCIVALQLVLFAVLSAFYFNGAVFVFSEVSFGLLQSRNML